MAIPQNNKLHLILEGVVTEKKVKSEKDPNNLNNLKKVLYVIKLSNIIRINKAL